MVDVCIKVENLTLFFMHRLVSFKQVFKDLGCLTEIWNVCFHLFLQKEAEIKKTSKAIKKKSLLLLKNIKTKKRKNLKILFPECYYMINITSFYIIMVKDPKIVLRKTVLLKISSRIFSKNFKHFEDKIYAPPSKKI